MVKLAENAYRDVNIAFANELSMIAAEHDVNPWELIELANNHPRVNILDPSPGVGGHCIAIDPWFLTGSDHGAALVEAARGVNNEKTQWVVDKILEEVRRGGWENIALYGLTYKPDVDDLRVSPALEIVKKSVAALPDRKIVVVDPLVRTEVADLSNATNVELVQALESAREKTLHVFLVAHTAFRSLQIFADSDVGILDFVGLKSSLLSKHEEV